MKPREANFAELTARLKNQRLFRPQHTLDKTESQPASRRTKASGGGGDELRPIR